MSEDRARSPVANALGWLLVVLGVLWMLLTGGCTAMSTISLLLDRNSEAAAFLPAYVIGGSILFLPGLAALLLGRMLLRPRLARSDPSS